MNTFAAGEGIVAVDEGLAVALSAGIDPVPFSVVSADHVIGVTGMDHIAPRRC